MQAAQVLSSTNAAVICVFVMLATQRPFVIHQPTRVTWVTALMGFIVNVAYLGFNLTPLFINAAEFGIICLLESILRPLWVFLLLGEKPSAYTLDGSGLLLSTMVVHEVATLLTHKKMKSHERKAMHMVEMPDSSCVLPQPATA